MRKLFISFLVIGFVSTLGYCEEKTDPETNKKLNQAYNDLAYNFGTLGDKVVWLPREVYVGTQIQMIRIVDRCNREIAECQRICKTPMRKFPKGTPIETRSALARDTIRDKNQARLQMSKAKKELAEYTIKPNSSRDVKSIEYHPVIAGAVMKGLCGEFIYPLKVIQVVSGNEAIVKTDLGSREEWFWLQGWDTSNFVDGKAIDGVSAIIEGTKTYNTVSGGSKTVWVAKPYTIKPYIAGITRDQFLDVLKQCEFPEEKFVSVWEKVKQENPKNFKMLLTEAMPMND